METRSLLGIDPGFANTGFAELTVHRDGSAELERIGTIKTKKLPKPPKATISDQTRRAQALAHSIGQVLGSHRISVVCSESLSHGFRNNVTSIQMGIAWGVLCAQLANLRIPFIQLSPQAIRKHTGLGRGASKEEIVESMERIYGKERISRIIGKMAKADRQHGFDALASATACLCMDELSAILWR